MVIVIEGCGMTLILPHSTTRGRRLPKPVACSNAYASCSTPAHSLVATTPLSRPTRADSGTTECRTPAHGEGRIAESCHSRRRRDRSEGGERMEAIIERVGGVDV